MTNPQKQRGDRYEREAAAVLTDLLGFHVERALGAGRKEDRGDLQGIPSTAIQVKAWARVGDSIRESVRGAERQKVHAGARWAMGMVPTVWRGRRIWIACTGGAIVADYREAWTTSASEAVDAAQTGRSVIVVRKGCEDVYVHPLDIWCDWWREAALVAGVI